MSHKDPSVIIYPPLARGVGGIPSAKVVWGLFHPSSFILPPFRRIAGGILLLLFLSAGCGPRVSPDLAGTVAGQGVSQVYSISGKVTTDGTIPLAGATVFDTAGHSTYAGLDGAYSLDGLPAGDYVLNASRRGVVFDQVDFHVSVPPSQTGINFTGKWRSLFPSIRRDQVLLFADDFSTPKGWLSMGGEQGLLGGEYRIYTGTGPLTLMAIAPVQDASIPASGYSIEADMLLVQGDDLAYGFVFDYKDTTGYCLFYVNPKLQSYAVLQYLNGSYNYITSGSSIGIQPIGNHLKLDRFRNELVIYVDGVRLGPAIPLAPGANRRVGLLLLDYKNAPAETHYDNFALYGIP